MRAVVVAVTIAVAGVMARAKEGTWVGTISDNTCKARHASDSKQGRPDDAHACTVACVRRGSLFVLVVGDEVYRIVQQELPALMKHAGRTVKVTGTREGAAVSITTIEPVAKKR